MNSPYNSNKILNHIDAIRNNQLVTVQIDLTNKCNLRCTHCLSQRFGEFNRIDEFSLFALVALLRDLKGSSIKSVEVTGGGEPMLHPYFCEFVEALTSFTKVGLVTNGTLINEDNAHILKSMEWIRVSIDATTPQTYDKIKQIPGYYPPSKKIIDILKSEGCYVSASFVMQRDNVHEIASFYHKSQDLGYENTRYTVHYAREGHCLTEAEVDIVYNQAEKIDGLSDMLLDRLEAPWKLKKTPCYYKRIVCAIGASGEVYPCCALKNACGYSYGNINHKPLLNIWEEKGVLDTMECPACWMQEKNECVDAVLKIPHPEFP